MIRTNPLIEPLAMHRHPPTPRLVAATLLAAVAVAVAGACGAAGAADKPKKEGSFGSAKPGGGYLTKEQLRNCLAQQSSSGRSDDGLQQERNALAATKAEVVRDGEALKARLDALDRTSADAVAAYNEQARDRDARVDQLEARIGSFNERALAATAQREAFAKACSNRRFFEEDEIAIKQGR